MLRRFIGEDDDNTSLAACARTLARPGQVCVVLMFEKCRLFVHAIRLRDRLEVMMVGSGDDDKRR